MIKKALTLLSILVALAFTSLAQEICNNGIDDDGDGLVDCDDPDCDFTPLIEKGCNCFDGIDNDGDGKIDVNDQDCASYYGLTFVGSDTDCSVPPPVTADIFDVGDAPAVSGQNTVDTQSKMAIGDVDGDGIPDVVATSKWNQTIRVIATTDGQADGSDAGDIKASWKTTDPSVGNILKAGGSTFYFDLETLIADVDGDGTAELFATIYQRDNSTKAILNYFIGRWDYDGSKALANTWAVNLGSKRPGTPGVADFDGDGIAEIYLKNRIYSAASGVLLANPGGDWNTEVNSAPVAVNIIGDSNLELVSGRYIYSVPSLASQSLVTLTVAMDMNSLGLAQYYPKVLNDVFEYGITNFSSTSVADFDDDGNIDVFMSGAEGSTAGPTTVFYWNVAKGTVGTFAPPHPDVAGVSYPNGWPWGTGRVNLGDLDKDGILEANFISGNQLWALEEGGTGTLVQLWSGPRTINDSRSGIVSTTVYDFNNDGYTELIYRDSQVLSIIDGLTGQTTSWSTSCQSHTMTEGPIIADVNGDGATDICVPCFRGPGLFKIDGDLSQQALGEIRLFFSNENAWLPTRKVYNQPGYFVVNINDDLTVPYPQLDQAMVFGSGACSNGLPGPQQPFNTFLNQVPTLGPEGCPVYPGPDISFVGTNPDPSSPDYVPPTDPNYFPAVEVIPPVCGDLGITVNFNIINDGLRAITTDIPVSFWDGDPSTDANAVLLHDVVLPVANFAVGDTLSYSGVTFNSTGKAFRLYIVLNDDGTTPPPFAITGAVDECNIGNNIYPFDITPEPFVVQLESIQDNIKCDDAAPDNGEIRAVVYENGVEAPDYSKYGFQWYDGPDTLSPLFPDPMGKMDRLTGIPEGSYTVVVTNLIKGCASLPTDTTIVRIGQDPIITIVENSPQTQCSPYNGELEVFVDGGNAGYTFEWYDNLFNPIGVTSAVATGLQAGEYIVAATKSGCTKTQSYTLNGPIFPDAQATTLADVENCTDPNSGIIDAEAVVNGVVQDPAGYDFTWYQWDPGTNTIGSQISSIYGTGKTRTGVPVGWYAVVVKNTGSNCESFPPVPTEVRDITVIPTVTLTELAPNTSCDPNNPNGQILVNIFEGGVQVSPTTYTIEWFRGDNTLPANQVFTTAGTNGEVVTSVGSPGIPYTAKVTSTLNCGTSDYLIVSQNQIEPVLTAVVVDNGICDKNFASDGKYNGQVNASVTFNGNPVTDFTNYTFTWYTGTDVTNSSKIIAGETAEDLMGLKAGFYSVIVTLDSVSCSSAPVTVEVKDNPIFPNIIITETPETTCSGTPNGELSAYVDVAGVPTTSGYFFEWHQGTNTNTNNNIIGSTNAIGALSGTEGETAIELEGGITYTVKVINTATGCSSVLSELLNDNSSVPVVTLAATPNTVCDELKGYTGTVTPTITDANGPFNDSDYTFNWYVGQDTSTPFADPDPLTPTVLDKVEGNYYTLVVVNNILGCESLPVYVEVKDNPPVITITSTNTPSTTCSGTPNGEITSDVWVDLNEDGSRDVGTEDDPSLFTYAWYAGSSVAGAVLSTSSTLIEAQGGASSYYTLEVIHNNSGCSNTFTTLLNDASALPVVQLTPTPNTGCVSGKFTGQIAPTILYKGVDVTSDPGFNFNYNWSGPNSYTSTTVGTIIELEDGDYTLTVTETNLGCISIPVIATVLDQPAPINITATQTPSTNCSGTPNGEIVSDIWVDLDGNGLKNVGIEDDLSLFNLQWYTGSSATVGNEIAGETTPTLSGIQGGAASYYTIEVENINAGCTNTFTVLLKDESELPVVTLTPTPNTGCETGKYTGKVTAVVTYKGSTLTALDPNFGDYTFTWTDATTNPVTYGYLADPFVLDSIPSGDYTLTIENTVLGCISLPVTSTVNDNKAVRNIVFDETINSSCSGTPNGQLIAGIDLDNDDIFDPGEDNTTDYTYTWYEGAGTGGSTPTIGSGPNIAIELDGNMIYTVVVYEDATGCTYEESIYLIKNIVIPQISTTASDYATCDPAAVNITVTIDNLADFPVGTTTADFEYTWYRGTSVTSGTVLTVPDDHLNILTEYDDGSGFVPITADDYTVVIKHDISECISNEATDRIEAPPAPLMDITPTANIIPSSCGGAGELEVTVTDLGSSPGPYTYTWHEGAPTNTAPGVSYNYDPGIANYDKITSTTTASYYTDPVVTFGPVIGGNSNILTGINPGLYTVEVTDGSPNSCKEYVTIELPFAEAQQDDIIAVTPDTSCDIDNGSIEVVVDPGGNVLNPSVTDYEIYLFAGTNPTLPSGATPLPIPTGYIETQTASAANNIFPSSGTLAPGVYTIVSQGMNGDRCFSTPTVVTIEEWAHEPIVNLNGTITANTSCGGANNNGELTLTINHNPDEQWAGTVADPEPTYTVTGSPALVGVYSGLGVGNVNITDLGPGTYDLTVKSSRGCTVTKTFEVPDAPEVADIMPLAITPADACDPSGSVIVTDISIAGTTPPAGTELISNYTFTWYEGPDYATASGAPAIWTQSGGANQGEILDVNTFPSMHAGTYWVVAVKTLGTSGVGCESAPISAVVPNTAVDPSFTYTTIANSVCSLDDASVDGSVTITASDNGAPIPVTTWTMTVTQDPWTTAGDPLPGDGRLNSVTQGSNIFTLNGLKPGNYSVQIEHDAAGCYVENPFNIPDNPIPPDVLDGDYTILPQDVCNPGGSVTVNAISITDDGGAPKFATGAGLGDYSFEWYEGTDFATASSIFGPVDGGVNPLTDGNYLNTDTYPTMQSGTYWVVVTKKVGTGDKGDGCSTPPIKFIVPNTAVNPTFTTSSTPNSVCAATDDASVDGTLTVTADDNGSPVAATSWTLTWTNDPWTLAGDPLPVGRLDNQIAQSGPTFTYTNLRPGNYDFTLTNDQAGCSISGSVNVPDNPIPPDVLDGDYTILPQDACNPGGSVTVNTISITDDGGAPKFATGAGLGDYSFEWYEGTDFATASSIFGPVDGGVNPLTDGNFLNVDTYPTMQSGTYWVVATKKVGTGDKGDGCSTPPIKFVVPNTAVDPAFTTTATPNSVCAATDDASVDGTLSVTANDNGSPVVALTWTLNWTNDPWTTAGDPIPAGRLDDQISQIGPTFTYTNLRPGDYAFTLTNVQAGCAITGSINVPDNPIPPDVLNGDYTITPQGTCNPGGSVTVNAISITDDGGSPDFADTPIELAEYTFEWYAGADFTTASSAGVIWTQTGGANQGEILDVNTYPTIQAGTYWVVVTKNAGSSGKGDGCTTPPINFTIDDISTDPTVSFTTKVNSSCDLANPNGSITATINEVSGTPDTYSGYTWTYNGGALPAAVTQTDGPTSSTLSDAPDGNYTVTMTNDVTGCSSTVGGVLKLDLSISEPNIITVDKTDPLDCLNSGTMEVTEVYIGGVPANVVDFEFDWYAGSIDPANMLTAHTALVTNVGPGQYFVIARDLNTKCESIEKEVDILDDQIIYPDVTINQDRPQTSCDLLNPNGELSATVDGGNSDTNPNYTFFWYAGPVPTGNPADVLATTSTITNLADGEYTVEVFSAASGCSGTATYILEDGTEEYRLQVSVTVLPVTLCNTDDGVLEARIINHPASPNFEFTWTGNNGFTATGSRVQNVPPGPYQVTAIDLTGEYCPSLISDGVVEDLRTDPPITIELNNPLINCDPARPNGQLSATVDRHVGGYSFTWYDGEDTSGPVTHIGNVYSNLDTGVYTVQVVDLATQCVSTASERVTNGQLFPPDPTAIVLHNLTSCETPNGEVEANVDGDVNNYYFDWYNGSTAPDRNDTSIPPDATGYNYGDLDLGDYTVTATDIETGCRSDGVTVPVADERIYPAFDYRITPANCDTDNGKVELVFNDAYNLRGVVWYDEFGSQIDVNTNLYNVEAGEYGVTVTTFLGCQADGSVTVPTEITNYNGISANGDGSNDDFQIDCITLFPNNNVKIYNRAGIKVYEADHYDNNEVVFDGKGKRGLYPFGEDLPDGTYFYIIDKGDGSRPKTGYLELIR